MPRAVVYLRVSTDEQAESGAGLKAQTDACARWAIQEDRGVCGPFADEAVSGAATLDKRPALLEALAEIGAGDVLLVAKRDRLGRDPLVIAMIEAAIRRKGGQVASAAGEGTADDEPGSILMRRMVDAFGEYERLIIRSRTRAALQAKRRRGERVGQVPLGRRLAEDGVNLVEDHAEVEVLDLIRQLRGEGMSLRAVAEELTRRGVPTKTGAPAWSHSTVQRVLDRPA